eukprot:365495-Chlamydomonas_euryale.AAC.5
MPAAIPSTHTCANASSHTQHPHMCQCQQPYPAPTHAFDPCCYKAMLTAIRSTPKRFVPTALLRTLTVCCTRSNTRGTPTKMAGRSTSASSCSLLMSP